MYTKTQNWGTATITVMKRIGDLSKAEKRKRVPPWMGSFAPCPLVWPDKVRMSINTSKKFQEDTKILAAKRAANG
jgi:hypothetical protein